MSSVHMRSRCAESLFVLFKLKAGAASRTAIVPASNYLIFHQLLPCSRPAALLSVV